MGWERGRYYTRSIWRNGRVFRRYIGKGVWGQLAALQDADRRERRHQEQIALREALALWQRAESPLRTFCRLTDILLRTALEEAGYYQHDRGEWRLSSNPVRRCGKMTRSKLAKDLRADPTLRALMDRAAQGDEAAWAELAKRLPSDWWEHFPSLGQQTAQTWLNMAAGKDLVMRESLEAQWRALIEGLGQTTDSSVEKLLVERVAACWIQTHYADALYASFHDKEAPLAVLKAAEQRMDRAQRRYLAALRQLSTLRRLLPAKQRRVVKDRTDSTAKCDRRRKNGRKDQARKATSMPGVLAERLRCLTGSKN